MKKFIISWSTQSGRKVIEAKNMEEARQDAFHAWQSEVYTTGAWKAEPYTKELAKDHDLE